jgi:L-ribulokinase
MKTQDTSSLVLGIDYGTDSCRAVVIDARDGKEIAQQVAPYPRWSKGQYCAPAENRFRQHPLDYIESLEAAMDGVFRKAGAETLKSVRGIAIDTTGSTPCAVTKEGVPLSLLPEFAEDPDAMFILWKDHTSTEEAAKINRLAKSSGGVDYTKFEGGIYSSEWFWAKALHVLSKNPKVAKAAHSFLEHCDWMPALLTGAAFDRIKRSRTAAGHKAMWHESFGGYPSEEFLAKLSLDLAAIRSTLGTKTYTSDEAFGGLTEEWAERLHLTAGITVAAGGFDAHIGAVGGGARPGVLVKVMGTSTCDMIVSPKDASKERLVVGICGQVDGSIIPGMLGYEAGQSAFGDVYAWFKKLLLWPAEAILPEMPGMDATAAAALKEKLDASIMTALEREAEKIAPADSNVLAIDWLNGRRTPDANQLLKGAITGLTLGTTAPMIYRALIEATAYGTKAIVERFKREGVPVGRIVAIGGVARKSKLVMQIVADVLDSSIDIVGSDQTVALGAAMFASVAAGIHADVAEAQAAMAPPIEKTVSPDKANVAVYSALYEKYLRLGAFVEGTKCR